MTFLTKESNKTITTKHLFQLLIFLSVRHELNENNRSATTFLEQISIKDMKTSNVDREVFYPELIIVSRAVRHFIKTVILRFNLAK